jgi:hypothetical protein
MGKMETGQSPANKPSSPPAAVPAKKSLRLLATLLVAIIALLIVIILVTLSYAFYHSNIPRIILSSPQIAVCTLRGGKPTFEGDVGKPICVIKYPDVGKPCNDKFDCVGRCFESEEQKIDDIVYIGKCEADDKPFRCEREVKAGKPVHGVAICQRWGPFLETGNIKKIFPPTD